jgi:hypothetical protein
MVHWHPPNSATSAAHATLILTLSKTRLFPDERRQAQVKVTGKAAKGNFGLVS